MNIDDLNTLYDYNYWARDQILDAATNLPDQLITAPTALYYGSLLGNMIHILNAEWIWRLRCQEGLSPTSFSLGEKITDLESLELASKEEEALMRAFLASMQDKDLSKPVYYKRMKGQEQMNLLWHILVHIVNHGTQHRAEGAAALTEYGQSPGDIDFIIYLRNLA